MYLKHLNPACAFGISVIASGLVSVAAASVAAADSTDNCPVPRRMLATKCTAEHYLAAVRDTSPVYYTQYMIDMHNKPHEKQAATIDRADEFFALDYVGRRAESGEIAVNYPPEPLTSSWSNWGKIFFNNKGVVAKATEVCGRYSSEMSVWEGP